MEQLGKEDTERSKETEEDKWLRILHKIFDIMDRDDSGYIDYEELFDFMHTLAEKLKLPVPTVE